MTAAAALAPALSSGSCASWAHATLRGVRRCLGDDIQRFLNKSPENRAVGDTLKSRMGALATPQLICLVLHRLSHWLFLNGYRRLAQTLARINQLLHKTNIPPQTCIGPGCLLPHPAAVFFLGSAGAGLTFYCCSSCCPRDPAPNASLDQAPRLGDRVTIGAHAVIIGPVTVGSDTKIAYGVAIDCNVPERVIAVSSSMRVQYTWTQQ